EPFLPHTTAKLRRMLGIGVLPWDDAFRTDLIGPGQELGKAEHLFKPITDVEIQPEIERLHATALEAQGSGATAPVQAVARGAAPSATGGAPVGRNIAFDDFAKLDLRVGTIVAA